MSVNVFQDQGYLHVTGGIGSPDGHCRPFDARASGSAPGNPAEELLAGIWRELPGIGEIGVRDDFFHLGGHSLMGLQLVSRIRDTFQVEIPLAALFEAPTISVLAELVDEAILLRLEETSDEEALGLMGGAPA